MTSHIVDVEKKIQSYWKDQQIFKQSLDLAKSRGYPLFNFYEGPPFASGSPHMGHLITKSIKDTVIRYKSQNGYYVPRVAGWDTHGLPLESKGQQRLQLNSRQDILNVGISKFNQACREIVMTARSDWEKTTERFGQWIDFEMDYKTMDFSYMNSVWYIFKQLYDKGLVYRGVKVMPYSTGCCTVWSNFEANQNMKEVTDPALTVKFPVDGVDHTYLLIFTTTPWTLPANLAVAVNPEFDYVYFQQGDEIHICEKNLAGPDVKILKTVKGTQLVGLRYRPPYPYYQDKFRELGFRVLPASFVTSKTGTGLVHLAPGFGADDYKTCLDAKIITKDLGPYGPPCPIDDEGKYTNEITDLKGIYVKDADKKILADLKKRNLVVKLTYEKHTYPFCWRTETPLLYRAYPSWFINVTILQDRLIANNKKITWVPKFVGENRFGNWLESVMDWCVSRNRFWGTPIPLWVNDDFTEILCIGSASELERCGYRKIDGNYVKLNHGDIKDLHRDHIDDIVIPSKTGSWLHRIDEIFDCWFESGAMPYASKNYPYCDDFMKYFPADFISESVDQVRGWFYTLNVLSTALYDQPAFKTCVVSGLVLAQDGQKMSKNKGNYSPPEEIMDKYGGDALRLYLLNSPVVAADILQFKDEDVEKIVRGFHIYLLNSVRFFIQMVDFYELTSEHKFNVSPLQRTTNIVDQWLVQRTNQYINDIHTLMSTYTLQNVYPKIYDYIQDLSNWYLKLNRSHMKAFHKSDCDRVYNSLNTLYWCLYHFVVMTAPFAPMLTESVFLDIRKYHELHRDINSVHLIQMPLSTSFIQDDLLRPFEHLTNIITMTRYLRGTLKISARRPIKELIVVCSDDTIIDGLQNLQYLLVDELNVVNLVFTNDESKYIQYTATIDHKNAGKKFRNRTGAIAKKVTELSSNEISEFMKSNKMTIGDDILSKDDIVIVRKSMYTQYHFHTSGVLSILLDPEMTNEMELMFIGKQLNRKIQDFRKELGLVISDMINMYYHTSNSQMLHILEHPDIYFKNVKMNLSPYTGQNYFAKTIFSYDDLEVEIFFTRS